MRSVKWLASRILRIALASSFSVDSIDSSFFDSFDCSFFDSFDSSFFRLVRLLVFSTRSTPRFFDSFDSTLHRHRTPHHDESMSDSDAKDDATATSGPLSVVDRQVVIVLNNCDESLSLTPSLERLHRLHGTALILSATRLLKRKASTFATACTIFHRFYHHTSLKKYNVWSVALASIILASKTEEEPGTIRHVVLVFAHLYRRARLILCDNPESLAKLDSIACSPKATTLSLAEKQQLLRHVQPMSPLCPVYEEWRKEATDMENVLLRQLGFTLYWIPDSHPHKFILYFVKVLEIDNANFCQVAWNWCNDSCRLDLCVRYEAELIACAAIHLAARDVKVAMPDGPWWRVFVGQDCSEDLSTICNALVGLKQQTELMELASTAFVKSVVEGGAFNDPDSYLWDQSD